MVNGNIKMKKKKNTHIKINANTNSCGFDWLKGSGWLLLYFSVTISSSRL